MNTKVILFDLYGTLLQVQKKKHAYEQVFFSQGLSSVNSLLRAKKQLMTNVYVTLQEYIDRSGVPCKGDVTLFQNFLDEEIESVQLYEETHEVLLALQEKEIKLGLISNLASPYKRPFFDNTLEKYFDLLLFSDEVGLKKPDSMIYKIATKGFGVVPEEVLMVGDNLVCDYNGPKNVGMQALFLDRKNKQPHQAKNNRITSLIEVLDRIT